MNEEAKRHIEKSLQAFSGGNLTERSIGLFGALGYATDRQAHLDSPTFDEFRKSFIQERARFDEEKALTKDWKYVDLLFQLTKEELSRDISIFDTKRVDRTVIEAYLFFVIELSGTSYSREALSHATRQLNRLFAMPALVLFKYGDCLTLSVIDRRLAKRDDTKDVLERVTLVKDVDIASPRRAQIELLHDLSLPELIRERDPKNFIELHAAWRSTLSISELNRKFYRKIADWYFWAVDNVEYPLTPGIQDPRESNSINVIRLLTRVIFVWFLREKHLVPDALFDEKKLAKMLKKSDLKSAKQSNYYRGVLQNLFFATLNQKMNTPQDPHSREWVSDKKGPRNQSDDFTVVNKFRFSELFEDPDEFVGLTSTIPFLNGGLFDCLDRGSENKYVDGFTRRSKYQPKVPNMLFFGEERTVDLSAIFGDARRNHEKVKGLIHILDEYKFTIDENTPIEEEVALDPELLGRVFENLLAAYNPETGTTARKATGSFYTPREIVNYMVDETLIAYFKACLLQHNPVSIELGTGQTDAFGNSARKGQLRFEEQIEPSRWTNQEEELEVQLRRLISYDNLEIGLDDSEKGALIESIQSIKILDPACGSGAFPMGVLHKLVQVLRKLDMDNLVWKKLQRRRALEESEAAYGGGGKDERDRLLLEISEAFDSRTNLPDYARKLYLIQNCIFGVDIQPIAVQISKLRFFISLLVDQNSNDDKANRGIMSLPNLETKFVAANTLIGIEKPIQEAFHDAEVGLLENELRKVRVNMFNARSYQQKKRLQKDDERLRLQLSEVICESAVKSHEIIEKRIADLEKAKEASKLKLKEPGLLVAKRKQHELNLERIDKDIARLNAKLGDADLVQANARRLANWDPYDQNAHAEFFDLEWMFGLTDGFDIVLGNPPYVRQEELKDLKPVLEKQYECFTGTSDLYVYFWERGVKLLRQGGTISYISSNKFFRAGYGEKLRAFLSDNTSFKTLIDFGDRPVFEATTYPCVLVASRSVAHHGTHMLTARTIETIQELEQFEDVVWNDAITMRQGDLRVEGWQIADRSILALLDKIKKMGKPLAEYVDGELYRGIITGCNEAFVIDDAMMEHLTANDKASQGLVRPLLRGRDVKRYVIDYQGLHVIYIPNGWTNENRKRQDPELFIKSSLPAIYAHLKPYERVLKKRDDKGEYWWELRPCTYLEEFAKKKIVYPNILKRPEFAFDKEGFVTNQKCFFIPRADKTLLAILNSRVSMFLFRQLLPKLRGDFFEPSYLYFSKFPIATGVGRDRLKIEEGINKIVAAKKKNKRADTTELEQELDEVVYDLYGLSKDEIRIVEGART